jgi:hypothetical protein
MIQERGNPSVTAVEHKDIDVALRSGASGDAQRCGLICYEAFRTIADRHGFPV